MPAFPPVQHIWFCSCSMPSLAPFTTCKVVVQADGDASSESLSLHPGISATERLSKGIALKTKVLASSWWEEFIPLSLSGLPLHPWRHSCGISSWSPSARTTATLTGAAIYTFLCLSLQGDRRRLARALSMASWNVEVSPLSMLPCLCLPQSSTVVQLGIWKVTSVSVSCDISLWIYRAMMDSFVNLLMLPVSISHPSCNFQKMTKKFQISKCWLPRWRV